LIYIAIIHKSYDSNSIIKIYDNDVMKHMHNGAQD